MHVVPANDRDGSMETVDIAGIAAGGAGVGRLADGRAVFVHRTAPGDRVRVRLTQRHERWARAELIAVHDQGPGRRPPPCAHYDRCGGCTLEHLEYPRQLDAKAVLVRDALHRIGGLAKLETPTVVASPDEFRYRNRVSFTLLRLGGDRVVSGFHELERPGRILDVTGACLLPEQAVAAAWDALRDAWGPGAARLPRGRRLRLTLRATHSGAVTLLIEGGRAGGGAGALLGAVPALASIWHRPKSGAEPRLLAGAARVEERWAEASTAVSGALFLQVNRRAAALLDEYVLAVAGDVAGRSVVDAYCGIGLHARRLAGRGAAVVGIEMDARAIAEASRAAPRVRFMTGPVEALLPTALPADLVIVNPPRAGLDASVCDTLRATPPARVLYVSCDPATLARDLGRLGPAFALRSLRCFDLFPQTAHVESVAELTCAIS